MGNLLVHSIQFSVYMYIFKQANVALGRLSRFLQAGDLEPENVERNDTVGELTHSFFVFIRSLCLTFVLE